jgi:HNH endonuclease
MRSGLVTIQLEYFGLIGRFDVMRIIERLEQWDELERQRDKDYGRGIYDPRFQTETDTLQDKYAKPDLDSGIRKRNLFVTRRLSGKARRNQCIRLARRDGWTCHWCDVELSLKVVDVRNDTEELRYPTIDHIITKSRGGNNHDDNCVIACQKCNSTRSNER